MKPIYAFGELLVDSLQQGGESEDGLLIPSARFYPGGAPVTAAVVAAGLGAKSHFIGQVGRDALGRYLKKALRHYGVDTRYLRSTDAPTPMAIVSMGDGGERSVQFYRQGTADVRLAAHKLPSPKEFPAGILHVCSNTLTEEHIRNVHLGFVDRCRGTGNLISFDVNLRKGLWPGQNNYHEPIKAMLTRADVIKVGRAELSELWDGNAEQRLVDLAFAHQAQAIYLTGGASPVTLITRHGREQAPVPVVDATSTVDAFSGAILASLAVSQGEPDWSAALALAVRCAGLTASGRGAFPSLPRQSDLK